MTSFKTNRDPSYVARIAGYFWTLACCVDDGQSWKSRFWRNDGWTMVSDVIILIFCCLGSDFLAGHTHTTVATLELYTIRHFQMAVPLPLKRLEYLLINTDPD